MMNCTSVALRLLMAMVCLGLRPFDLPVLTAQSAISLSNPSGCGLGLPIADYTCPDDLSYDEPNRFNIIVNNAPGGILGVDVALKEVRLILAHEWVSDVNIRLVSPSGVRAQLVKNAGSRDDHFGDPDDAACQLYARMQVYACQSIQSGIPPFLDGPYRPLEDLWVFNDGSTDPNGIWQLLICDDLPGEAGTLEYVELVFEPVACLPVQALEVINTDSTTVVLGYQPEDICGSAIVEVGPVGFTPGTGAAAGGGLIFSFNSSCPPISIGGLDPETAYDVYLRRFCVSTGAYSVNSCPVSFQTGCLPPPATAIETFDNLAQCSPVCNAPCNTPNGVWRNTAFGDQLDWIAYSGPTPSAPLTGPSGDVSGNGKYLYIEANGAACAAGAVARLTSGCFTLNKQGSDDCHLSFNYHMSGINIGQLRLSASTDGGFTWTLLWQRSGNTGPSWQKAYISLAAFTDGTPIQFRFEGTKGNGNFGDIALDQIVVYGSTYEGYPDRLYYADLDADGFGRSNAVPVLSCLTTPPPGYADNNADCNDNPANGGSGIYPGAPEIACNGIDENCNQATVDDDIILPLPTVFSDTICSGETALICAEGLPDAFILWYSQPTGMEEVLEFAPCFSPILPANTGTTPVVYRFYAEQTTFTCTSARAEVVVVVNPSPQGVANSPVALCPGTGYDLNLINVQDLAFTGAALSWHTESPASAANELTQTHFTADTAARFFFLLSSQEGCTDEGQVDIVLKPAPVLNFLPADSFSLCRESVGWIQASAGGSAGGYTFLWSNGITTPFQQVAASAQAGTLQQFPLQVTDADGCQTLDTVQVLTTNSIDSIRISTRAVSECNGADGQITVVPLNGLPPFQYSWTSTNGDSGSGSFGPDTLRLTQLSQGAYRITLTDASPQGCEARLRNIRVQGPGFLLGEHEVNQPSCFGFDDGSICLAVSGSSNLQYTWSTGADTPCLENLAAGIYQVTITNGACTSIERFTLAAPDPLGATLKPTHPSCPGQNDGSLEALVFGGVQPYLFQWSASGGQDGWLPNIGAGVYAVSITDANGCMLIAENTLSTAPPLIIETDTLIPPSCFGTADGILSLRGVGGTGPYHFNWDNGSTQSLRTGLSTGAYGVTLTDSKGCTATQTIVVLEPSQLVVSTLSSSPPLCPSAADGIIELQTQGGTPPYQYYWDGVPYFDNFRDQLSEGEYTIEARDQRGCRSQPIVTHLQAATRIRLTVTPTSPLCQGRTDGRLQIVAQGGFTPYQIRWADGFIGATRNNLGAGSYPITVTDGQGCTLDTTLSLSAPQVFQLSAASAQPSCFGINDGIISTVLTQSSGIAPIAYLWNDGNTQAQRSGLAPGAYQLTLSDGQGCKLTTDSFFMHYPSVLKLSTLEISANDCAGQAQGAIEVALSGGTPPYGYQWVGQGVTLPLIEGLPAGPYRLVAQDSKGCFKDTVFTITQPPQLLVELNLTEGQSCVFGAPTLLSANANGGTPPYHYYWINGSEDPVLTDPLPGDYYITLTDANGCQTQAGAIKVRNSVPAIALTTFEISPVTCFGSRDARVTAGIAGGSGLYRFHFSDGLIDSVAGHSYTLSGLPHSDSYSVTITDLNTGCMVEAEAPATQPLPLVITRDAVQDVRCFGGADGRISVTVQGGVQPYQFAWVNGAADTVSREEDLRFARDDVYTLWVNDNRGCMAALTDSSINTLSTLIEIVDSLTVITTPACRSEATGAIELTIVGGAPPYQYAWSNGRDTEDIFNIPAGFYEITVTDSDTCRRIFPPIFVTQPATALVINSEKEDASCYGANDGYILLGVFGGGAPYGFTWRRNGQLLPSAQGPSLTDLGPGNYNVVITDHNGCVRMRDFNVSEPELLVVSIINIPPGSPNLAASASGGAPPYYYNWSTEEQTPDIIAPGSGAYSVTVLDDNDCVAQEATLLVGAADPGPAPINPFIVYPNPAGKRAYLQWRQTPPSMARLLIFDAAGRLAFSGTVGNASITDIDLSNLLPGVYFWRVSTPDHNHWLKVVIAGAE